MLTKFRNLYPQGSILSELIDIDRGIYIVRVSIQIDGVTLATGLAGAEVVEKAEDSARNRALQALVLEDGHLSLNLATKAPQKVTNSSQITASAHSNDRHNSSIANPPTTVVPQEEVVTATVKPQIPNPPVQGSLLSEPSVAAKNIAKPEPEPIPNLPLPETPISIPEYKEDIVEPPLDLTSDPADVTPISPFPHSKASEDKLGQATFEDKPELRNPHSRASAHQEKEPPFEGKRASLTKSEEAEGLIPSSYGGTRTPRPSSLGARSGAEETSAGSHRFQGGVSLTPPEEPSVTETPTEFDFNQIRHKIDLEMKRLSWTKEQGRDYLLSTYGKRSRLHLTDDELLEFWHYLETLPN